MANYGSVATMGDPRSPGWEERNLADVWSSNGQHWRVHRAAAPSFNGLLKDLISAGYNPTSSGGFNYRTIRGSDKLSQHAFGLAADISAATNPMLSGRLQTDMPSNVGEMAARWGLEWGGNWQNRPDPMHFEWKGPGGAAPPPVLPERAPSMLAGPFMPPALQAPAPITGVRDRIEDRRQEEAARRTALLGGGDLAALFA